MPEAIFLADLLDWIDAQRREILLLGPLSGAVSTETAWVLRLHFDPVFDCPFTVVFQALDGAELHASFAHQLPMLQSALGLAPETPINRGESSACDVFMVSGLMRLGEAAAAVISGDANCMLGHAAAGPALQQNLLCLFGDQP